MTPWAWEFTITFTLLAVVSWYFESRYSGDVDRAAWAVKQFLKRVKRTYRNL